ncbi:MAG: bifunctional folylpolyglutamate synthase/dihydrofolate synthase [Actinomycetota bacterium]
MSSVHFSNSTHIGTTHRTDLLTDPRHWLDSHFNLEAAGAPSPARRASAPTRARIRALLELLGSPQLAYPAVHLTGTNGKTSTVRMITALLTTVGTAVGAYTSPHLESVNERISCKGVPIGDLDLDEVLRAVARAEHAAGIQPSYFEILTAAAFRWFADIAVDLAVVEVGLGGTWDATNEIDGRVAVVTNVAIDHVDYLGPTREQIAAEKAGIVKPGATLVLGEVDAQLTEIFEARGAARVIRRHVDFGVSRNELAVGGRVVDLFTPGATYLGVYLPLHGAHQADNAAIALATAEAFMDAPLHPDTVAHAFARVTSPGRLEVMRRQPLVLLDGAHNVAGAQALRAALTEEFAPAPRTLVVGLLREKEPHEMLAALGLDDASVLVVCRAPSPRALEPNDIAKAAIELGFDPEHIEVVERVEEAIGVAVIGAPEDGQVVVTGSLYVVGAARAIFTTRERTWRTGRSET